MASLTFINWHRKNPLQQRTDHPPERAKPLKYPLLVAMRSFWFSTLIQLQQNPLKRVFLIIWIEGVSIGHVLWSGNIRISSLWLLNRGFDLQEAWKTAQRKYLPQSNLSTYKRHIDSKDFCTWRPGCSQNRGIDPRIWRKDDTLSSRKIACG